MIVCRTSTDKAPLSPVSGHEWVIWDSA